MKFLLFLHSQSVLVSERTTIFYLFFPFFSTNVLSVFITFLVKFYHSFLSLFLIWSVFFDCLYRSFWSLALSHRWFWPVLTPNLPFSLRCTKCDLYQFLVTTHLVVNCTGPKSRKLAKCSMNRQRFRRNAIKRSASNSWAMSIHYSYRLSAWIISNAHLLVFFFFFARLCVTFNFLHLVTVKFL